MAGCEYLPNIERVGLKVALKHFSREKSFEKVIEYLKKQKTYLDRIPAVYISEA
jgi:5'-3' exonuclease